MDWFAKAFIKASLAWLALGVTLGVAMAIEPMWVMYRPAHVHMSLLGFVTMMIFGVAYHVIPRFTGNALYSRRLGSVHWVVANLGLSLMAGGFIAMPHVGVAARIPLAAGGVLSALGAYLFVYNMWRTLDGRSKPVATRAVPRPAVPAEAPRRLPMLG